MINFNKEELDYKNQVLKEGIKQRRMEILGYQINIDNYTLALNTLQSNTDEDLQQFKSNLESLLKSEITEQKKSKVLLDVLLQQVQEE